MIYASVLGLGAFCILLYFMRLDTLKRGKAEAEKEIMEASLDDIHLVQTAKNRLRAVDDADLALRDKLRNKYTRKP